MGQRQTLKFTINDSLLKSLILEYSNGIFDVKYGFYKLDSEQDYRLSQFCKSYLGKSQI